MLGAILGDIVGSPYEFDHNNYKHKDFPLLSEKSHFTDDTAMPVTAGCSAGGCTQKIRSPMVVSATARLCGCRQQAGCSTRWTKHWKWQK